ncbi:molecular chaperone DnaJ [Wolbachia endosymbiont (group B) of Ischnura elegans]|uniref:molecular chaperone DnaJ n=1 Tax=Wolbachia endosymbiont (group B) of Ischnura elegans TaxID=2954021 RepID=UPI002230E8DB|nr:molecular chaperone DnaJ [Wolbachia endosymbiont (group B) of Ischnura elegans]
MGQHFKLTGQEFYDNNDLFNVLEIKAEQIVGKDYQALSKFLKKQYNKLILVNHPDKGGDKNRFNQICKAHQELKKYIEPLKSGNPCVKVSVDAESDGHLTAREFHYRKKLFEKLNITEEEVIGKNFVELASILKKKNSSLEEDLKHKDKLICDIKYWAIYGSLFDDKVKKLRNELDEHLMKPNMQLFNYISSLEKCGSLIREDKQVLTQKFIKRRDDLLSSILKAKVYTLLPLALAEASYCYYFLPIWLIASNTLMCLCLPLVALNSIMVQFLALLTEHYGKKYKNYEISTDKYVSRMNCIYLCYSLCVFYPLPIFFTYLMIEGFISGSFYVDVTIFGTLSLLALLATEIFSPTFSKGCEIYTEKHMKDLLEEDPRDRVQKETDLLGRYDPRKLLMPIIMPLVRKCFAEVASEFAERNFDEVKTDMSDVNTEGLSNPQAIEFAQQTV